MLHFASPRTDWRLDAVSILAILGESNIKLNSHLITSTRLCYLPRLMPAPQGLLDERRMKQLPQEEDVKVAGVLNGNKAEGLQAIVNGFWVSQRSDNGQSIINAAGSREQGVLLTKVSAFVFDQSNHFLERVESTTASLQSGHWRLEDARVYAPGAPPDEREFYLLATNLTPEQVRETFSTPETSMLRALISSIYSFAWTRTSLGFCGLWMPSQEKRPTRRSLSLTTSSSPS